MTTEIELPYLMFGDQFPIVVTSYNICSGCEEKRIRVYSEQLANTIVESTTLANFNWHIGVYFKFGTRLVSRYPHRECELNRTMMRFWKRMQNKYKQLKGNL